MLAMGLSGISGIVAPIGFFLGGQKRSPHTHTLHTAIRKAVLS